MCDIQTLPFLFLKTPQNMILTHSVTVTSTIPTSVSLPLSRGTSIQPRSFKLYRQPRRHRLLLRPPRLHRPPLQRLQPLTPRCTAVTPLSVPSPTTTCPSTVPCAAGNRRHPSGGRRPETPSRSALRNPTARRSLMHQASSRCPLLRWRQRKIPQPRWGAA